MNCRLAPFAAFLLFCSLPAPLLAGSDTPKSAASLSQVRGKIESADGRAAYDEQMNGTPRPDGFGTRLPPGLGAGDVVKLLLPGADPALATLVGMKPWPHGKDTYIAIACMAPSPAARKSALDDNSGQPVCSQPEEAGQAEGYTVALALVQMRPHEHAALASPVLRWTGSKSPLATSWQHSNLEGPGGLEAGDATVTSPSQLVRFDFARYRISDTTTAFGMRSAWEEGYAGGTGSFQALALFAVINGELRVVFSEPIYYLKNLAGDWHKDGTRSHEVYEGENVVAISPTLTDGYFNLIVRSKKKPWRQEFRWDKTALRYSAVN